MNVDREYTETVQSGDECFSEGLVQTDESNESAHTIASAILTTIVARSIGLDQNDYAHVARESRSVRFANTLSTSPISVTAAEGEFDALLAASDRRFHNHSRYLHA